MFFLVLLTNVKSKKGLCYVTEYFIHTQGKCIHLKVIIHFLYKLTSTSREHCDLITSFSGTSIVIQINYQLLILVTRLFESLIKNNPNNINDKRNRYRKNYILCTL